MANMAQQDVTVPQLRALDYEYAARFGQLVSTAVLDIVEASDKLEVFDHAYQWQMWAAAQARGASFDRDPFAGMLELWALAGQQRRHFTEGGGKTRLRANRPSPSRLPSGWSATSGKLPRR